MQGSLEWNLQCLGKYQGGAVPAPLGEQINDIHLIYLSIYLSVYLSTDRSIYLIFDCHQPTQLGYGYIYNSIVTSNLGYLRFTTLYELLDTPFRICRAVPPSTPWWCDTWLAGLGLQWTHNDQQQLALLWCGATTVNKHPPASPTHPREKNTMWTTKKRQWGAAQKVSSLQFPKGPPKIQKDINRYQQVSTSEGRPMMARHLDPFSEPAPHAGRPMRANSVSLAILSTSVRSHGHGHGWLRGRLSRSPCVKWPCRTAQP